MAWNIIIPIITLVIGAVGGFIGGVFYIRKQLEKMQSDPSMIADMAKKMGYNLNKQQLNKAQQMMKNKKFK